jgi:hypothetical protein
MHVLKSLQETSSSARICLVHNPSADSVSSEASRSSRLASLWAADRLDIPSLSAELVHPSHPSINNDSPSVDLAELGHRFARQAGLDMGQSGLVINGRVSYSPSLPTPLLTYWSTKVIGPFAEDAFVAADFETLVDYEIKMRMDPVLAAFHDSSFGLDSLSR